MRCFPEVTRFGGREDPSHIPPVYCFAKFAFLVCSAGLKPRANPFQGFAALIYDFHVFQPSSVNPDCVFVFICQPELKSGGPAANSLDSNKIRAPYLKLTVGIISSQQMYNSCFVTFQRLQIIRGKFKWISTYKKRCTFCTKGKMHVGKLGLGQNHAVTFTRPDSRSHNHAANKHAEPKSRSPHVSQIYTENIIIIPIINFFF